MKFNKLVILCASIALFSTCLSCTYYILNIVSLRNKDDSTKIFEKPEIKTSNRQSIKIFLNLKIRRKYSNN